MKITTLGTRGSISVEGKAFWEFGGATSCVRIEAGKEEIYLDAGSGIVGAVPKADSNLSILVTHPHLDHMIGLPFFKGMTEKDRLIDIYMKKRNGLGVREVLRYLYTPPLWPVGVFDYPANVRTPNLWDDFSIGEVQVAVMEGVHPGGVSVYRLTYCDSSVVFATDFEHEDEEKFGELVRFSKDADLLIFDGQYTEEEYGSHKGFGHSTIKRGIGVAKEANVSSLWITHHDPGHTDEILLDLERKAKQLFEEVRFARCGDEVIL